MEVEGGGNESTKKQAYERSVNGDPDYGKEEAKDTENGTNEIRPWAPEFTIFGIVILVLIIFIALCIGQKKISEKNSLR